jgi:hypothetical protein
MTVGVGGRDSTRRRNAHPYGHFEPGFRFTDMGFYDTIILTITNGDFIMYKVTYAIDSMDSNPTIKYFDLFDEAENWLHEEVQNRVQWCVDHSPYTISEEEHIHLQEEEYLLTRLEEVEKVNA